MNRVSSLRASAIYLSTSMILLSGFMCAAILQDHRISCSLLPVPFVFGIQLLIMFFWNLSLCDVSITDRSVHFITVFTKQSFTITELLINDVAVTPMGPFFLVETNCGTYRINYTWGNCHEIACLLKKANHSHVTLEVFEKRIHMAWRTPRGAKPTGTSAGV